MKNRILMYAFALFSASAAASSLTAGAEVVPGSDPRIEFSDCLVGKVVRDVQSGAAWVDRVLENARGYRWDAPGARVRFRTDSAVVTVRLRYSARHIGPANNSVGFWRIDGRGDTVAWRFERPRLLDTEGKAKKLSYEAELALRLPVPDAGEAAMGRAGEGTAATAGAFHDYELILPYGDAVDVLGVEVAAGVHWEKPSPRPAVRWVAFGDSVTHGFTASSVAGSYPFQVAEAKGWQVINQGIGGRSAAAKDGDFLAGVEGNLFSVAIGVNNWQGGTEIEVFRKNMSELLRRLRGGHPDAPVYVITPLWVPPTWRPKTAKYPLDEYRRAIGEVVAACVAAGDARMTLVDGPSLIDHDAALFDKVAVHPNDAGFAQMAERLARAMK
ncbi:SGNH/GDSL hydrolase family protein [Geminisphaera colitermitum]|uniref:SGNH/GDSL hydrolase family protein n=1 Tax=Geminisphaera colitermitum TaxID=1148786 RepID=UPI0001964D38|nr:GDSL-type esterase/lipase family protein [Geminisphaera colitermitum]